MLNNKIDFAVIFSAKNANPNGDPLAGNRPRTTSDGLGEVSDVCLKRKIRNRIQEEKNNIFVQSDNNCIDGKRSLSDRFNDFIKTLPANEQKDKNFIIKKVCEKWFDIRAFGQVFAFESDDNETEATNEKKGKKKGVSIGIRGPVTIQSAFSTEPVTIESIQIVKSVNGKTTKSGEKSEDTMGMKHRVNKAIYITYGSISPQLSEKTGFSDEDAEKIKQALVTLFEGDESSARPSGSMEIVEVIWFKHNNKSGQYSSAKVHESVTVDKDGNIKINPLDGLTPERIKG